MSRALLSPLLGIQGETKVTWSEWSEVREQEPDFRTLFTELLIRPVFIWG